MNQREANRLAHGICSSLLQNFLDVGGPDQWGKTESDAVRIYNAVDAMAQREFELGGNVNLIQP